MKPSDPLSDLLHTWRPEPSPQPDFNAGVWSRIQSHDTAASQDADVVAFPSRSWPFPLAAGFAILLSAALGTGAALAYGSSKREQQMASAYARSIDPLQRSADLRGGHHHP